MRFITKAFIISAALISTTSFATDTTGETFAKTISNASSWKQLLASFKPDLNPLVAKELAVITQDLPFPTFRVRKGSLMISNENGEHMTLMFFKKNGAVTLNGKEWTIRPLATPEAEVQRLVEMLNAKADVSLMELVIPSAHAGGLNLSTSVAAATYASATAWKGQACKQEDISQELIASCSLMAVLMPVPGNSSSDIGPTTYLSTQLKCPAENGGVLELISKNQKGTTAKIQVSFASGKPPFVFLALAPKDSAFKQILSVNPESNLSDEERVKADKIKHQGDTLMKSVCQGSKSERTNFYQEVEENVTFLQTRASNEEPSTEKKSSSGL
jgi:hypothetical protein